jgi:hypothetical protein
MFGRRRGSTIKFIVKEPTHRQEHNENKKKPGERQKENQNQEKDDPLAA